VLAVVKRLIEMHGGEVAAESPGLGWGSTFKMRLPRVAKPRSRSPEPAAFEVPPRLDVEAIKAKARRKRGRGA